MSTRPAINLHRRYLGAVPNKAEAHRQSPSLYKTALCARCVITFHLSTGRRSFVITNIHEHAWSIFCREKAVWPDGQNTREALFGKLEGLRCICCASMQNHIAV